MDGTGCQEGTCLRHLTIASSRLATLAADAKAVITPYNFDKMDIDLDSDGDLFVGDYWGRCKFLRNL